MDRGHSVLHTAKPFRLSRRSCRIVSKRPTTGSCNIVISLQQHDIVDTSLKRRSSPPTAGSFVDNRVGNTRHFSDETRQRDHLLHSQQLTPVNDTFRKVPITSLSQNSPLVRRHRLFSSSDSRNVPRTQLSVSGLCFCVSSCCYRGCKINQFKTQKTSPFLEIVSMTAGNMESWRFIRAWFPCFPQQNRPLDTTNTQSHKVTELKF